VKEGENDVGGGRGGGAGGHQFEVINWKKHKRVSQKFVILWVQLAKRENNLKIRYHKSQF
jgi:hypothetical protein